MSTTKTAVPWDQLWVQPEFKYVGIGPSFKHRARYIVKFLNKHSIRGKFLDVGCGSGNCTALLLPFATSVAGIDISKVAVDACTQRFPQGKFQEWNIENAPLTEKFDGMVCVSALEEMKDDTAAITHMASMLNPGGHVIFFVPHRMELWSNKDDLGVNYRRYDKKDFCKKLENLGLVIVESVTWGWPLYSLWYGAMTKVNQTSVWQNPVKRFFSYLASKVAYGALFVDDLFVNSDQGRLLVVVAKKPA